MPKAPCKRTHVDATSPNIVGIVLADVGFRVFKRSQHVGQCCFYGNMEGSLGLIFTQNSLRNWKVVTFVRQYINTPSHISKDRELKQRGQERQRECHKTIDLITEYNHFMWECNHLAHWSPENKTNVGICWAKSLTDF